MAILNWHSSIAKPPQIVASSALPSDSSPPSPSPRRPHLVKPPKLAKTDDKRLEIKLEQQQPSVLEIERAIGAGIFRDRDINSGEEERSSKSVFDNLLRNSVGKTEGSVEKKLRETGEWLIHQTETSSSSSGKQIVMTMFVWVMPMWIAAFLVASGIVQLPFDTPFLHDLVS